MPAGMVAKVPVSKVVNLSQVFGESTETERFVTRYLRAQHADLFFADAAILVEGPAERMLIPNFIRAHYKVLHQSYVTLLEIGGSHAHPIAYIRLVTRAPIRIESDPDQNVGHANGICLAGLDQDVQISGDALGAVVLHAQAAHHHEPHLHGHQLL